ncbi:MAG: dihydroorotate dehydrogenase electron transfer subunit [Candidatus Omnitrophica bacterium]|nr:dihydroorotate dehydrogenase electron transfer subunit [Candidatus Omnitrophota bacterium]
MAKRIFQTKTKILSNICVGERFYKLTFLAPGIARCARPGQFLNIRISEEYTPFLRRPFSIHKLVHSSKLIVHSQRKNLKADGIEILYEVVGKGTEILSEKKPGEYLDVLGPLGNGFNLSAIRYPLSAILVGGGIGVAPLLFLAQKLIEYYPLSAIRYPLVLIGAKTKKEILCKKEFESLGCRVKISTDDGSSGFKGKVTDLLKHLLRAKSYQRGTIYACGPKPMLKEITLLSRQYGIPGQISLDEYMACGMGVCLGCLVETYEGRKLVCRDGPVFDTSIIKGGDR